MQEKVGGSMSEEKLIDALCGQQGSRAGLTSCAALEQGQVNFHDVELR